MTKTKIEWADKVWNPVTGCSKVSEGCKNCYAERHAKRFWGDRKFSDVQCHEDRLKQPFNWRKPSRVFVNSMSDLFHKDVPLPFIADVFHYIEKANDHTFVVLTKRPERMLELMSTSVENGYPPPENIWLGVSVENQETADERIPLLLKTPAAKRIISFEPALGPIDFKKWIWHPDWNSADNPDLIDWVIMGGESGPKARPMHPDWARSVRDQCQDAEVPFFFKQWGEWYPDNKRIFEARSMIFGDTSIYKLGKKKSGRLLDDRVWEEVPEICSL
ncbi:MAG: phage Gp37/Gp68 family protein [Anaerolineaceae bacterium]|nr:phage Gp37/Gp68 family protein [Anaerolineaceae bacterium]